VIDPLFAIMGAVEGVEYSISAVEVFAVYPAVILAVTALAAFLTSLYTATIKPSDTADIE
jgi:putative ABC transport system permease protein